eukprot:scaffold7460_cov430-Prasinococcus_capsulatus_cf.AAC.2
MQAETEVEPEVLTLRVPDVQHPVAPPASGRCPRLHFQWGTGNRLHLHHLLKPSAHAEEPPLDNEGRALRAAAGGQIHLVTWAECSLSQRRVAYDTLPLLLRLAEEQSTDGTGEVLAESQQSSLSALQTYAYEASVALGRVVPGTAQENATEDGAEVDHSLAKQRAVWELIDSVYVQRSASAVVTEVSAQPGACGGGLVSWLHRNYAALPHGEASATARLSNLLPLLRREAELPGAPVEQRPDFWPTLHSLIALGWIGTAIELLGFHSVWARERVRGQREELASAEVELLSALMALLRTLPRFLPTGSPNQDSLVGRLFTDSAAPFLRFRELWRGQCEQLKHNDILLSAACPPETNEGVRRALDILLGEENAINTVTEGWVEYMVANLLHRYPSAKAFSDVPVLAREALDAKGSKPKGIDDLLLAVFDLDVQEVVRLCYCQVGWEWMLAHVCPLLESAGPAARSCLRRPLLNTLGATQQSEVFMLQYANALATNPNLWEVAAEYMAMCPSVGRRAIHAFFQHLPMHGSQNLGHKVVSWAQAHGLGGTAQGLCCTIGMHMWREGHRALALDWFQRGGSHKHVDYLSQTFLTTSPAPRTQKSSERRQNGGDREHPWVVEALGTNEMECSVPLLSCYQQLKEHLQMRDSASGTTHARDAAGTAGQCLLHLLAVAPRKLWMRLLVEALPLIADPAPDQGLTTASLHRLLALVHELHSCGHCGELIVVPEVGWTYLVGLATIR